MNAFANHIELSNKKFDVLLHSGIGVSLLFVVLGIYTDTLWLGVLFPITCVGLFLLTYYPKRLYMLLFAMIPLSTELVIGGGFSTDFPGEPLLWTFTILAFLLLISQPIPRGLLYPIGCILGIQVLWMSTICLFADQCIPSLKYTMAKIWYVLPFYILPFYLIKNRIDLHKLLDIYLVGVFIASSYFFVSHAFLDFDFLSKTEVGKPIWRNHVNYACCLVISLPIAIYRRYTCDSLVVWRYTLLSIALIIFMYFSYARVVYLCIGFASVYIFILHFRLTKIAIILCILLLTFLSFEQINQAKYVRLAPDYNSAIMQESFDKKIAATLNGKDISTMERLHRWVAGLHMIEDKPLTGVGPSNFYSSYKKYTVHSFETYVSDNPEKSGIHNYYLMTAVEQGIPGLLILLVLIITTLIHIENAYHNSKSKSAKNLLLLSGICIVIILSLNSINDMLEVIKVGGIFYFMLFIAITAINPLFLQQKGNCLNISVPYSPNDKS